MTSPFVARLAPLLAMFLLTACPADETDTDVGTDTGSDTGSDTQPPWTCDDVADYKGDEAWTWALDVPRTLTLCGTFDEYRTLNSELKVKAQLQIPAGRYGMPTEAEGAPIRTPACVRTLDGSRRVSGPMGAIDVTQSKYDGNVSYYVVSRQTFAGGGQLSILGSALQKKGDPLDDMKLLNVAPDPWADTSLWMSWCEDELASNDEYCTKDRGTTFVVCNPTSFVLQTHTLEFAGGDMVLEVRMGESAASTEPAAFVAASGTLDGQEFSQKDYWKLIYRPEHHHFIRNFAVLFDQPISGACGVRVLRLDPWGDSGELPKLDLVQCDLTPLESREVTSNVWDSGD